jgi:DNA-binding NarL/FixJ family response regulator
MTVRLLLADDHPVVREGLRVLLESEPDLEVVGQADNGNEVGSLVEELHPDVVVLDLMMPGRSGLDVIGELAERSPAPHVLVLSMVQSEAYVVEALHHGASGYALKQAEAPEIPKAIRDVAAGRRYLSPALSERAIEAYAGRSRSDPYDSLTAREREVLVLVAEGHTSVAIADRLFISPRTVETHRARVMRKLGLRTHVELVRYALHQGIFPPGSLGARGRTDP